MPGEKSLPPKNDIAKARADDGVRLTSVRAGTRAVVVTVGGGHGVRHRLSLLGVRPGAELQKVSSLFLRGPVVVQVGGRQVAIGHGMAERIRIRVTGE